MSLQQKVALITGANRGIGRAIALRLAKEGALVIVHYARHDNEAQMVKETITRQGGKALVMQADLASIAGLDVLFRAIDKVLPEETGSNQLDIVVNNAGI